MIFLTGLTLNYKKRILNVKCAITECNTMQILYVKRHFDVKIRSYIKKNCCFCFTMPANLFFGWY
uniref:Uncharacterized protein n=1 Tax=Daphnia magna TaxID=35525 RepID=A0A0N8DJ70_9CRUS